MIMRYSRIDNVIDRYSSSEMQRQNIKKLIYVIYILRHMNNWFRELPFTKWINKNSTIFLSITPLKQISDKKKYIYKFLTFIREQIEKKERGKRQVNIHFHQGRKMRFVIRQKTDKINNKIERNSLSIYEGKGRLPYFAGCGYYYND